MKKLLLLILALALSIASFSQLNGDAKLIEFTNSSATFTVPMGKTWQIVNIWSDFLINVDVRNQEYDDVCIFIKSINGSVQTNLVKLKYGGLAYRGSDNGRSLRQIILPENSTITFVIASVKNGAAKENNNLTGFLNYIEMTN